MDKEIQKHFLTLQEAWFWFTYERGPFDLFKSMWTSLLCNCTTC